jgi:hypothetical protein
MNMKAAMKYYGINHAVLESMAEDEILNSALRDTNFWGATDIIPKFDKHFENLAKIENEMEQMAGHASVANFFGENTLLEITDAEREADVDITTNTDNTTGDVKSVMVNSISNTSDEIVTTTIDRERARRILQNRENIQNELKNNIESAKSVGDTEAAAAAQKQLDQFNLIVESLQKIAGNKTNSNVTFSMSTEQTHIPGIENLLKRELPKIFG